MTDTRTPSPALFSWWREADAEARRALIAGGSGWMLDAMDFMLYSCAILAIGKEFDLSLLKSGALAAAPIIASAIGGTCAGYLADRFGRTRMLTISILTFSVFTACTATSQNVWQFVFWRILVGLGMGAEWSCGAVLVAETWPAKHRGKAIGLMQSGWAIGYIFAALLAAAAGLFFFVPYFRQQPQLFIWVGVFYVLTLGLEMRILLAGLTRPPENAAPFSREPQASAAEAQRSTAARG